MDQSGVSAPLRNLAQEFKSREPEENKEHRFLLPAESNFGNVLLYNHTKEKRRWRRKGEQGTHCWGKQLRFGKGFVPKTPTLWSKLTFKVVNQLAAMNTKLNTLTQVEYWIKNKIVIYMNFSQTVLLVEKRIGLVEEQVRLLSRKWNNPSRKEKCMSLLVWTVTCCLKYSFEILINIWSHLHLPFLALWPLISWVSKW